MWSRIWNFFNSAVRKFREILKNVFVGAVEVGMAQIQGLANQIVKELQSTNMNNDQKREAAFNRIKDIATLKGMSIKDNWINIAIGIGVEVLKKEF